MRSRVAGALLLGLVLAADLAWSEPFYNWDVLAYAAVALELRGLDPEAVHREVYAETRATVSDWRYWELTASGPYRSTVAQDSRALHEQVPFYRVKIAYPFLMGVAARTGMSHLEASVLISRVAYVGIGLVLWIWLAGAVGATGGALAAGAIMSTTWLLPLARLSTPDALSALVALSAIYLWSARGFTRSALAVLVVSLLIRPDNVLLLLAVCAVVGWLEPSRRRLALGVGLLGVVATWGLLTVTDAHSWKVLLYHSFVEYLPYPSEVDASLSLADYAYIYLRSAHPKNLSLGMMPFSGLLGLVAWRRWRLGGLSDPWLRAGIAVGAFLVTRWLAFPRAEDRYFVVPFTFTMVALVATLLPGRASSPDSPATGATPAP